MLSIEKCNKILNEKGQKYSKEEVTAIREKLYQIAEIIHQAKRIKDDTAITR
jgi:hypothetical protein